VRRRGFTLIELLVVMAIIALLLALSAPVLRKARYQARTVVGMGNQREIVTALNTYAADNDGDYPMSVATVGVEDGFWHWHEPMRLAAREQLAVGLHRAMSEYLGSYISDVKKLHCPKAPRKYKYLEQSWEAGDAWNNPETPRPFDPVSGTYCFWWNYLGYLEGGRKFRGPSGSAGRRGESKLAVSCYFGWWGWRAREAYGRCAYLSCERLDGGGVIEESYISSAYWSKFEVGQVRLQAGYTDGHVESFSSAETVPLRVAITEDGSEAYEDDIGPGVIFIPQAAVRR